MWVWIADVFNDLKNKLFVCVLCNTSPLEWCQITLYASDNSVRYWQTTNEVSGLYRIGISHELVFVLAEAVVTVHANSGRFDRDVIQVMV